MRYEEYKDSGVEWIGEVPSHWELCKIKHAYSFATGGTPKSDVKEYYNGDILWANISDLGTKYITDTQKKLTAKGVKACSMSLSPKGSLLYSFKLSVGTVSFCGIDMYTNEAIATFNSSKNDLNYLYYMAPLLIVKNANKNIYDADILNQDLIKNAIVILPPIAEQRAIASYLDTECGKIDGMIATQNKRIELLQELKQSIITTAVTRGLNSDVELNDSGVEWIGEIPSNWNIVPLCKSIWLRGRLGWKGLKADEYVEEGYPFLSAFNIINNSLDWSELNYITKERYDESPEIKLSVGDVLIVKDGAGLGKCARVSELPLGEATVNSSLGVITPNKNLYGSYLYYYFLSQPFQSNIQLVRNGMGVPHLTHENMKTMYLPLPPIEEQQSIAIHLDKECARIDSLISTQQRRTDLLQELKRSLITEVVTGKQKVC